MPPGIDLRSNESCDLVGIVIEHLRALVARVGQREEGVVYCDGRIRVRVADRADVHLDVVRTFDADASAHGSELSLQLDDPEAQTAAVVRSLVTAGADVIEVHPEHAGLEDVYLHFVKPRDAATP